MKMVSRTVFGTLGAIFSTTALATPAEAQRYRRYDRRYDDGRHGDRGCGSGHQASIEACAYEAEREADRRFGGRAQVRGIGDAGSGRDGYRARGTLEVQPDTRYGRNRRGGRVTGFSVGSNDAYGD